MACCWGLEKRLPNTFSAPLSTCSCRLGSGSRVDSVGADWEGWGRWQVSSEAGWSYVHAQVGGATVPVVSPVSPVSVCKWLEGTGPARGTALPQQPGRGETGAVRASGRSHTSDWEWSACSTTGSCGGCHMTSSVTTTTGCHGYTLPVAMATHYQLPWLHTTGCHGYSRVSLLPALWQVDEAHDDHKDDGNTGNDDAGYRTSSEHEGNGVTCR